MGQSRKELQPLHPAHPVALRDYQLEALTRLAARRAAGVERILLVAPTGAGKTTIAAQLVADAVRAGKRVLFIAHRREIITQAYERFADFGFEERQLGVIMGTDPRTNVGGIVQVASIDSLRRRRKPLADLVIWDECHRAMAATYRETQKHYDRATHLGLTATPYRADGQGLREAFDELLIVSTPRQLIDAGYLVEPLVYTLPPERLPDLSRVRVRGGDYEAGALGRAVNRAAIVGQLVTQWQRHASELRTVVFAVNIPHSEHITLRFQQAGIAAEHLDGRTPKPERDAILARLDTGETQVVSNVGVLQEGWDQPSVKCAILARPTQSTGLYIQMAGRILRPWQNSRAVILDHAGSVYAHGLPHSDRHFTLEDGELRERSEAVPRRCPACSVVIAPVAQTCPSCGIELPRPRAAKRDRSRAHVGNARGLRQRFCREEGPLESAVRNRRRTRLQAGLVQPSLQRPLWALAATPLPTTVDRGRVPPRSNRSLPARIRPARSSHHLGRH